MKESAVQAKIKRKLEQAGWFVTKLIQTSTNGIPDLLALRGGRAVFIEVKRPGGKPSDLQGYMLEKLQGLGFTALVATNENDIESLLK